MATTTTSSQNNSVKQEGFVRFIKNAFCSYSSTIVATFSYFPADTIKVRMQMLQQPFSKVVKQLAGEGFLSFYKGVDVALYNMPLITSLDFFGFELGKWMLGLGPTQDPSLVQSIQCGVQSATLSLSIVVPMELIKSNLQMANLQNPGKKATILTVGREIVRQNGFRGLYKGLLPSACRDWPAMSAYFTTYYLVKRKLMEENDQNHLLHFMAGVAAGSAQYLFGFPQDVVKTRVQLDGTGANRKYHRHRLFDDGGMISCAKDLYRTQGIRGFFRGYPAAASKAVVFDGMFFTCYEFMKGKVFGKGEQLEQMTM